MISGKHLLTVLVGVAVSVQLAAGGEGNLRYSVSISEFKNEANWRGKWNLGHGFETLMTDRLKATDQFIVLATSEMRNAAMDEQDFAAGGRAAGGKKAPKVGRMTPAQLLVRGSITHVQSTAGGGGGIGFKGIRVGGSGGKAEINMTIYMMDTETGQVVASKSVTGKSYKRGLKLGYYGSGLGGLTGSLGGFLDDNVGKASADAVDQAVEFLIAQLEDIPWEGSVVLASATKIIINRGSREGVSVGMEFEAGEVQELVDPDTGEVLDSEMSKVGSLKVTEVKEKIAYCEAVTGGEKIKQGMTVFPK